MFNFAPFMIKLQKGYSLDCADFEEIFSAIMEDRFDEVQLAGLLVLISERSLYADSLAAFVREVLKYSHTYSDTTAMFDIVGTGGDTLKTINISTACAIISAYFGVRVAKHGNRAISSLAGSSDTLDALGIKLSDDLNKLRTLIKNHNLAFFHAPFFHKATAKVASVRSKLKIGTIFNILGPLLNPNIALSHQIMGNYLGEVNELLAYTLEKLGRKHALVVHGLDGMDEISLCDETLISELKDKTIISYKINPEEFGFKRVFHADIAGGDAKTNAKILQDILSGKLKGAKRDIVVLNAMFALYTADIVTSPKDARNLIESALDSSKILEFWQNYLRVVNEN